jgi:hypothetical protein
MSVAKRRELALPRKSRLWKLFKVCQANVCSATSAQPCLLDLKPFCGALADGAW